ncbi:MAG: uncharacterized protein A8A55_0658 [Amphiamblys sp. WSBS2006]|nr:MAG: uncharacterized protein A8A55_0658 [Amphiamblys sp. WSBS2006]
MEKRNKPTTSVASVLDTFSPLKPAIKKRVFETQNDEKNSRMSLLRQKQKTIGECTPRPDTPAASSPRTPRRQTQEDRTQESIINSVIKETIEKHIAVLRNDIQNMHIELIKRFHTQKEEFEKTLKTHLPGKDTVEELEELRKENRRIKEELAFYQK